MKNKILFYIDTWFLHFGIAQSMQNKIDSELYAVIDTDDKAKTFFQNQQLVDFKKTWFLRDQLSDITQEVDIDYLENFEKKYKINLWRIAYTDRKFYQYNSHYNFSENEILSLLQQECKFIENVLDESSPDYFLTLTTLTHPHHLLYEVCKSREIKVLMLNPVKFGHRMMISENTTTFDDILLSSSKELKKDKNELQNFLKQFDSFKTISEIKTRSFESRKWERYKANLKFFLDAGNANYKAYYQNYGRTRWKILSEKISRSVKRKTRESFIDKNFVKNLDFNKPFIYFPLHYEPERILLVDAPFYDNQLAVIMNIAKSLPVNYLLCVKEHPMMRTLGWRDLSFYKQIMDLPNVKLIHSLITPQEILQKCSMVITIAGTAAQEAAFYGKPSIVFSDQLYSMIPFIYRIQKIEELPEMIRNVLEKRVNLLEVNEFVNYIEQQSFEFDIQKMASDFAFRFGFKGPVMEAELPLEKVESFLNDYKKDFDSLAENHIRKIQQIQKNTN